MKKQKRKPSNTRVYKLNETIKTLTAKLKVGRAQHVSLENALKFEKSKTEQAQRNYERENQYKIDAIKEKDRFYTESNQKTAKIARLETIVVSLREGTQKILTGFNTLN